MFARTKPQILKGSNAQGEGKKKGVERKEEKRNRRQRGSANFEISTCSRGKVKRSRCGSTKLKKGRRPFGESKRVFRNTAQAIRKRAKRRLFGHGAFRKWKAGGSTRGHKKAASKILKPAMLPEDASPEAHRG